MTYLYLIHDLIVERDVNGTVTLHHADQPYSDCNSFVKWSDAHSRMMAARQS